MARKQSKSPARHPTRTPNRAKRSSLAPALNAYLQRSNRPLHALWFLLPLMLLYELGVILFVGDYDIVARQMIRGFFGWFGVHMYFLPGLIVIAMLLSWHLARKDPWEFDPETYLFMLLESAILALPLLVLLGLIGQRLASLGALDSLVQVDLTHASSLIDLAKKSAGGGGGWRAQLVFSIGAGIYEELVFRVVLIALLHWILVDLLALPDQWGSIAAVLVSALAFAMYHFSPGNPFTAAKLVVYTVGGSYLAMVYVVRGFGIAAGTHAVYDILVVAL